jgi:hypothetical protein
MWLFKGLDLCSPFFIISLGEAPRAKARGIRAKASELWIFNI